VLAVVRSGFEPVLGGVGIEVLVDPLAGGLAFPEGFL
jgi:hypothetical protein